MMRRSDMLLRFNLDLEIEAPLWRDELEKQNYIKNVENTLNKGLSSVRAENWKINNIQIKE